MNLHPVERLQRKVKIGMNIDWKRVAKPQPDGYDSVVIAKFLFDRFGWVKKKPNCQFTLCDGHVAIAADPIHLDENMVQSHMINAHHLWNDEHAAQLDPYLRQWYDGHEMLKLFLDEFWPKWSTNMSAGSRGCTSGHYDLKHGNIGRFVNAVYITINSTQGCAEGIYHEVGHARLNALNLCIEAHDGTLITNTKDELYESPIRRDKKRPMSAVVQAIYSWIIFGENDLQVAALPGNAFASAEYLIGNLPKLEDGLVTIRENVKCTPEGTKFMDGFFEWGEDVATRARMLCQQELGTDFDRRYGVACKYRDVKVPD